MSDVSIFEDVKVKGQDGCLYLCDGEIIFEGKSALGTSRSAFSLAAVKEDVMKPVTASVDLKLEADGASDTVSIEMTSLGEVVRFRKDLAQKMKQLSEKTTGAPAEVPDLVNMADSTPTRKPPRQSRSDDLRATKEREKAAMGDASSRSTASRPGVVRVQGPAPDAGNRKSRRNRVSVSLRPDEISAAMDGEVQQAEPKTEKNTNEPSVLIGRQSSKSPSRRRPASDESRRDTSSDDDMDDTSDFAEDDNAMNDVSAMSQSRSLRRNTATAAVGVAGTAQFVSGSAHSQEQRRKMGQGASMRSMSSSSSRRGPGARGGDAVVGAYAQMSDSSQGARTRRESEKMQAGRKSSKQNVTEEDPPQRDLEAAVRRKEEALMGSLPPPAAVPNTNLDAAVRRKEEAVLGSLPVPVQVSNTNLDAAVQKKEDALSLPPPVEASNENMDAAVRKKEEYLMESLPAPVGAPNKNLDAAVRMKEESLLKGGALPTMVEMSTDNAADLKSAEFSTFMSMEEGTSKDKDGNFLIEAKLVTENSQILTPTTVASAVDLEQEDKQRKRTLYKVGGGCCLLLIAVIVVAVLAATGVIGGGGDTGIYQVPTLTPEERFALIRDHVSGVVYDPTTLDDMNSPQRKALQWMATEDTYHSKLVEIDETIEEKLEQRYTLAVFYYAMVKASRWEYCSPPETGEVMACVHPVLESYANEGVFFDQRMSEPAFRWLSSTDECTWAGVKCTDGVHVSKLQLAGYKLQGILPIELGFLRSLQVLDLQQNSLAGSLPPQWGVLETDNTALESIRLDRNQLTGSIPEEWCQLSAESLKNLVLSNNQLTGTIPSCLSKFGEMENFSVMSNSLTGTVPTDLGILLHLHTFHVANNNLNGQFPDALCNLMRYEMTEASADCGNESSDNFVECECCTTCCDGDSDECSLVREEP